MKRRAFLLGLSAVVASPAIVRASSLMAIKMERAAIPLLEDWEVQNFQRAMLQNIAASFGVPYGKLTADYSAPLYSSARSCLLDAWKAENAEKRNRLRLMVRPLLPLVVQ